MKKHLLTSSINRAGLIALGILAVSLGTTRARADSFQFVWDEQADGLHGITWQNGNVIQDANVGPESYSGSYGLWNSGLLASDVDLSFNIYEPSSTVLSDTFHLFGSQGSGSLNIPFISEAVTPLDNAVSIYETGAYQYVATTTLTNGDVYEWGFRSGTASVPDTGSGIAGLLTLVGLCVVKFRRQIGRRVQ